MRRLMIRVLGPGVLLGVWLLPATAFADFLFKQGNFTKPAAPAPQIIGTVGFRPKAVIFYWTRQTTSDVPAVHIQTGYGLTTGIANQRAVAISDQDNVAVGNSRKGQWNSSIVIMGNDFTNGDVVGQANLTSFDPTGFTLDWVTADATQNIIHYVALGGTDIVNAKADSFAITAGAGALPVGTVGFKPDFLMFVSVTTGAPDSDTTEAHLSLGFASSNTDEHTVSTELEDGTFGAGRSSCVIQLPKVLARMDDNCAQDLQLDLASFDPTGFTLTKEINPTLTGQLVHYLALQGGEYKVGKFDKATAVGPDPQTGVGFTPVGLVLASSNLPTSGAVQVEGRMSFGAADGTNEGAIWYHDQDGGTTDANMLSSTGKVAVHATSTGAGGATPPTLNAEADLQSFDPDGFTLNWTTNGAPAAEMLYVAFGPTTAASVDTLFKKGSFKKTATTPGPVSQSITGVGFRPKAIIFYWTRQTASDTFNPNIQTGYGFTSGTLNQRLIAMAANDGVTDQFVKAQSQSSVILLISDAIPVPGTVGAQAQLSSLDADGFTLNWVINEARADIIHYIALGGSDIRNAKADSFIKATGTGPQPVTGVGFKPDFLMLLGAHMSDPEGNQREGALSIGFASSPTEEASVSIQAQDSPPAGDNTCVYQRTDRMLVELSGTCTEDTRFDLVSFDADGFTLDRQVNNNDFRPVHYLALQGGKYKVGSFNKSTAPGPVDDPVATVGFSPVGLILASKNLVSNPVLEPEGRLSFGASDGGAEGATWWHYTDGAPDANERTSTGRVAVHATSPATLDAQADLKSFDPNGFTLTWTTNNAVAHEVLYVAFGNDALYRSIGTRPNYGTAEAEGGGTTVSATRGSRLVTGSATAVWQSANRGRGDRINIAGVNYTVSRVLSETRLELTGPYMGTSGGGKTYAIARQFGGPTALQDWENCIDGGPCPSFPVNSASLVADNRSEVGIAYKETALARVVIEGSTTDASHAITLTADNGNRHGGVAGNGVVIDNSTVDPAVDVNDDFVTVEWLEIKGGFGGGADGIHLEFLTGGANANRIVLRNNLIHNVGADGIQIRDVDTIVDAYNNVIYRTNSTGIRISVTPLALNSRLRILNNTVFFNAGDGVSMASGASPDTLLLQNNISHSNVVDDFNVLDALDVASSNNLASDATATPHNPAGGPPGLDNVPLGPGAGTVSFNNTALGSENLHLRNDSFAIDKGANLGGIFTWDIDGRVRTTIPLAWEIGADDTALATAVSLLSFEASPLDSAVQLRWTTGSELRNLGFHLHRSLSAEGPYARITSTVIPGLGSSPLGASYRYVDGGLVNGVTYYYKLEDIETTGEIKLHGPVQATPRAGGPADESGEGGGGQRIQYGDPAQNRLRLTRLGPNEVLLELVTEGFFAVRQLDGTVRIEVPGFLGTAEPGAPAIPTKRAWVEALAGRGVGLSGLSLTDVVAFEGLRPAAEGLPELAVGKDGTLRAVSKKRREGEAFRRAGVYPAEAARLIEVAFQGDVKKALVDLSPLRWDVASQQLLLAKRLSVRVLFAGAEPSESSLGGSHGRRSTRGRTTPGTVLARLVARGRGLYGVRFEDLFGASPTGIGVWKLRLSHRGEAVAFHVEPEAKVFGPGSVLYFVSEGSSLNPWGTESVYELEIGTGVTMEVVEGAPAGSTLSSYWKGVEVEQNLNYQSGLLEARDLWLWEGLVSPVTKSYAFTVNQLAASSEPSHVTVLVEGGSDYEEAPDHHVRVSVNGIFVGETSWDGKRPAQIEAEIPAGVLHEGANQLQVENVGDTGAAYSYVFLDKFNVSYPRLLEAEAGVLSGSFSQGGVAQVSGLARALVVDTTAEPKWVRTARATFAVEGGRSYLAVDPVSVLRPEVRVPVVSGLRSVDNRADYLLIGPREFLSAAEPLLSRRASQGLVTKAVAVEDVFEEFGHGEASPSAVKEFIAYAYHQWQGPSVRYVVLFGDGSYDYKGHVANGKANRVLPLLVKTTYLWTASDPSYGAVNGEDNLPDVAVGRLPASTLTEAQTLVAKVLAFEDSGLGLGGKAVLAADNADAAGEFEANSEEIASMMAGREVERIYLRDYGGGMRGAITDAFNRGSSLMSYVGHGGVAVWASENFFNNGDVNSLVPQPAQPFLMTMNCLNGFFHGPVLDSVSEVLVKASDKGAIAAFSPSGLSVDVYAHEYQKALVRELESSAHARLGDAILAAQAAYADTGAMPELLEIYHLLGDPGMALR